MLQFVTEHSVRHMRAVLVRDIPIRVLDFSLSGCRVAVDHRLDEAVVGRLCVTLDGNKYQDTVQTVRALEHPGAGPSRTMGGRFAWATSPGTVSIRGACRWIWDGTSRAARHPTQRSDST